MNFDQIIDRRGIKSMKWDGMENYFGVSPDDGIAMWVADKDFAAPSFLQKAAQELVDNGNYGYFTGRDEYLEAVAWWMKTRHGWEPDPSWMFTTVGLGNAIAMLLHCFSEPGDSVVTFTPVYHEFANKIRKANRMVRELPLQTDDTGYVMDFAAYDSMMTGTEKIALLCSPHNPAGRVWTRDELRDLAAFCERHDLLLVSDEIHQDLVFSGHRHVPMAVAAPEIESRLVTITAASKTFSIAGCRTGTVTIGDPKLRDAFGSFYHSLNMSENILGVALTTAAYSPEGAAYVDALCAYLEENARVFKAGVDSIPGVKVMNMQGTYLAWVDFSGTGMSRDEFSDRVFKTAKIAVTPGHTLGTGGETFLRFNVATRRSLVLEAIDRLNLAFRDLQ